jgi:hypothetical protein
VVSLNFRPENITPLASYDVPGQCMLEGRDIKRTTIWALTGNRQQL